LKWDSIAGVDAVNPANVATAKNSRSPQSESTVANEYLRRRVWRTSKRLRLRATHNYVNLASALFLRTVPMLTLSQSSSQLSADGTLTPLVYYFFPELGYLHAGYLIFNHILCKNSPHTSPIPKAYELQAEIRTESMKAFRTLA